MSIQISRRALTILAPIGVVVAATWAKAAPVSFTVPLTGAQQVPPVQTTATGAAALTYDAATRTLTWSVTFSGLSSGPTMAHFHGPAAQGANAPPTIWISTKDQPVTSPIKGEATLTPDQATQFLAGQWYVNVHSKDHAGGEIRGQVVPPKA